MNIQIGNMPWYFSAYAINLARMLPVVVDVIKDNDVLRENALYIRIHLRCINGNDYMVVL